MAIKINIASLNDGSQQLEFVCDSKELELGDNFVKDPVNIVLDLYKTVYQLDVKILIKGVLLLTCDRCLDEFELPFESSLELIFVQKSSREEEINEDNIRSYFAHMRVIDITNDIKETIILASPMKKLPAERSDGSCTWCGKTKEYWRSLIVEKDEDEL
ncbi:MAG: DUF177 domain-containing protein [Ignavibacteria bacterium]|nr:DUF177 domain-containing protein [Ignavibacteria bacterium]